MIIEIKWKPNLELYQRLEKKLKIVDDKVKNVHNHDITLL